MEISEHLRLAPYTTFRLGGEAAYVCDIDSREDVEAFANFAQEKHLPIWMLGGGSNVIFPDTGVFNACVGHMCIKGFEVIEEDDEQAVIKIGAGEEWDDVVAKTVAFRLSGIEALSAIPGTAGATPIQNVGAYGQEIADTLVSLEAYDVDEKKFVSIAKNECGFAYRDSNFKNKWRGRYVIVSITLKLSKKAPSMPAYQGVEAHFKKLDIQNPSLGQIREAIIEIRKQKLPDPKLIASCGSFFKNSIISKEKADELQAAFPGIVLFPAGEGFKAAAGWMIEKAGLKGKVMGNLEVYQYNALVLVNRGGATRKEVEKAAASIVGQVEELFGVRLEPEAVFAA